MKSKQHKSTVVRQTKECMPEEFTSRLIRVSGSSRLMHSAMSLRAKPHVTSTDTLFCWRASTFSNLSTALEYSLMASCKTVQIKSQNQNQTIQQQVAYILTMMLSSTCSLSSLLTRDATVGCSLMIVFIINTARPQLKCRQKSRRVHNRQACMSVALDGSSQSRSQSCC